MRSMKTNGNSSTRPCDMHHTYIRTMTGYSTASELANEKGSIAGCRAMVGGLSDVLPMQEIRTRLCGKL